MFLIRSLAGASGELGRVYSARLGRSNYPDAPLLRGPVGLFIVRPDGASGSKLAEEVVGSFGYWNGRRSHFFDGIFLGLGFDGVPAFDEKAFHQFIGELEERLEWSYEGGANLLLTDFVYNVRVGAGDLDFSQAMPLDMSKLLDEEKLKALSPLIEELIAPIRRRRADEAELSVWDVSDYIALLRTRRLLWQTLVKKMGALLGWVDELAPYAVRDMRRVR
jgi:hypothetical protein